MFARGVILVPLLVVLLAGAARAELTPLSIKLENAGYERIASRDGVTVYKYRDSDVIRIAGEAWFAVAPDRVREALLDYEHQPSILGRLSESRFLARGSNWALVYQRLNLPVVSDRDFVLRVRWGQNVARGVEWITYQAVDSGTPERPGVVRVIDHEGSWQLQATPGGTRVRFQASIDLAGSVPKWMARAGAGKEVPDLFLGVCRLVDEQPQGTRGGQACILNRS